MTELTLKIERPEDLVLVLQLAQRLGIPCMQPKPEKAVGRKRKTDINGTTQLNVFAQMEALQTKLHVYPVPAAIDIEQLANEVNAV